MSTEHIDRGRALEEAVKFIQQTLLNASPTLKGTHFIIETNVRDTSSGVLHEIDVLVRTQPGTDYEAKVLFECKNWSKSVDKNAVLILAKKVEALHASRGYLVARSLSKHAQAQIKQEKRLEFIRCTEDFLSPLNNVEIVHRTIELLPIVIQIKERHSAPSSDPQPLDSKNLDCRLNGQPQALAAYIKPHIDEMIRDDEKEHRTKYLNEGTHWGQAAVQISFSEGELMIGQIDVEYVVIPIQFLIETRRSKIISKFELEGRGRSYSFEPIKDFGDGKQLEIHMVQKL